MTRQPPRQTEGRLPSPAALLAAAVLGACTQDPSPPAPEVQPKETEATVHHTDGNARNSIGFDLGPHVVLEIRYMDNIGARVDDSNPFCLHLSCSETQKRHHASRTKHLHDEETT